ncbi:MAG TPA: BamA/TamA family outer membrane protein [Gemmatimonadaceae bacterium]|nr:BamA/TamA family outer membrane protein [Gemmatimonadaceae bacterium]
MRGAGHRVGRGALSSVRIALAVVALTAARASIARAQDVLCESTNTEVHALRFEGNTTFSDAQLSSYVITTPSSLTRRTLAKIGISHGGARRCYPDVGLKPDVDSLTLLYRLNGFYDTRVDTVVTPAGRNAVDITFRIQEGQPLILDTLSITGLDSVANADELLRKLPLQVGRRVGPQQLSEAFELLITSLRNMGYPHADALRQFDTHKAEHRAEVGLAVTTGPLSHFGTIAVHRQGPPGHESSPSIDSAVVLKLIGFKSGDVYSDTALVGASRNLYNLGTYRHVGILVDSTWPGGQSVAVVSMDLREDLMNQIDQDEGFGTLDCFRTNTQYTYKNFNGDAAQATLTARFSKLGYGDPLSTEFLKKHLCGYLNADSLGSSKVNDYIGGTIQYPTLLGTKWRPAFSAYTERRGQYRSYLRTTDVGFSPSATRMVRPFIPLTLAYTFEHGKVNADNAVLCGVFNRCTPEEREDVQKRQAFGVASISLQSNRTDNLLSPTTGYAWAGEFRTSSPLTASDPSLTFNKVTGDVSAFHPFNSRTVFAARLRGGYIAGGTTASGTTLPPPQERLYGGGYNSVRGFGQNELGPQVYLLDPDAFSDDTIAFNPDGSTTEKLVSNGKRPQRAVPSGGNVLLVANAEVRVRGGILPSAVEIAPFVDAGQVWVTQTGKRINVDQLRVTPGISFRYFLAFAPIQVNLGYNPYPPVTGIAYFAQPVSGKANLAPLICVTSPGDTPVTFIRQPITGAITQEGLASCPSSYQPPAASNFIQRLGLGHFGQHIVFTINIGSEF